MNHRFTLLEGLIVFSILSIVLAVTVVTCSSAIREEENAAHCLEWRETGGMICEGNEFRQTCRPEEVCIQYEEGYIPK